MQKLKSFKKYISLICIVIILFLGFFPFSSSIHFAKKNTDDEGEIISVSYVKDDMLISDTDTLPLSKELTKEDEITLRTSADNYYVYFTYAGITTGKITLSAKDSEYLSRITLDTFIQDEVTIYPENLYFEEGLTFSEFIQSYKEEGYAFLFAVKGDSSLGFDNEMVSTLNDLGLSITPSSLDENASYIACVYKDTIFEKDNNLGSTYHSILLDGHTVELTSAGVYYGNNARIRIDGEEISAQGNGINIVVYDPENNTVIDSVSFNTNTLTPEMERTDTPFYTEKIITLSGSLFEQVEAYTEVMRWIIRILSILLSLWIYFLSLDINKIKIVKEEGILPHKKWFVRKQVYLYLIWIIYVALVVTLNYLLDNFASITIDQLVFHMNTNLEGTNWSTFLPTVLEALEFIGIAVVGCTIVLLIQKHFIKNAEKSKSNQYKVKQFSSMILIHKLGMVSGIVMISIVISSLWSSYYASDYFAAKQIETELYDKYYTDASSVNITFPEEKKNLIYIYLESMEMSLADESVGGGKSDNIIPELTSIALENDCFNGDTNTLNGAIPLYNSTWTIAGMVAESSGLPLGINHVLSNVKGSISSFMPGAYTLGDILEEEGYHNVLMLGSNAKFGNRNAYYEEHGNYEILDYTWANENDKLPYKDYYVWWGYEDTLLFENAKEELTELAKSNEPFALTMLTVDTHFTNGYLCDECPDTYADQYSNVLACSSKQVSKLLEWIQQQDWHEDTVIVLNGDHLCMDSNYYSDMPEDYERKTYTAIINSTKEETEQVRTYSTMDLFPTVLSAMGVKIEGDRLGFGTDLYSDTPTLLEELGENYMNYELSLKSSYYDETILGY